ncbi:MAG: hypothetical protein M5R41_08655 [Bacteroidia bacterium]|nr:hypothetical protein [Bacteroidia bacterium]
MTEYHIRPTPPRRLLPFLLAALSVAACSTPPLVQYVGHSYEATEKVDLFLAEDPIPRAHRVMGRLQAEAAFEYRADRIQEYVLKYAAERGAHAVIIEGLDIIEGEPVHETQIVEKKRDDAKSTSVSVTDSVKNAATERQRSAERSRRVEQPSDTLQSGSRAGETQPAATRTKQIERSAGESTTSTTIRELSYRPRWLHLRATLIRYE